MNTRNARRKQMLIAYVLSEDIDFGFRMTDIARLFGVSKSTISNWVKEMGYQIRIRNLELELADAKDSAEILAPRLLEDDDSIFYIE